MDNPFDELPKGDPSVRALESYLRFSYPLGNGIFPEEQPVSYPEIHFNTEPERPEEEYLNELIKILDVMFEEERRYSEAAFLSSGVDSSLIACGIHAKKTFSVAYEEEDCDESRLAIKTAQKLESEHHIVRIGPADYFDAVMDAMSCRKAPTGDASYIALFLAAREASRHTDTICSGEGPDEMFCGYPCYSRYFDAPAEDFWLGVNTNMDVGEIPVLPDYGGDGFLKMNAFDLTRWMQGNILPNLSAAAEGANIQIRTPYMRPDLLDLALSLPVKYKADRFMGKLLFRKAAMRYTGREAAFREKRGFPVPIRKWVQIEPYKTRILDALTDTLARDILGCVDVPGILRAFYETGEEGLWKQVWEMFALMCWLRTQSSRRSELVCRDLGRPAVRLPEN